MTMPESTAQVGISVNRARLTWFAYDIDQSVSMVARGSKKTRALWLSTTEYMKRQKVHWSRCLGSKRRKCFLDVFDLLPRTAALGQVDPLELVLGALVPVGKGIIESKSPKNNNERCRLQIDIVIGNDEEDSFANEIIGELLLRKGTQDTFDVFEPFWHDVCSELVLVHVDMNVSDRFRRLEVLVDDCKVEGSVARFNRETKDLDRVLHCIKRPLKNGDLLESMILETTRIDRRHVDCKTTSRNDVKDMKRIVSFSSKEMMSKEKN